MAEKDTVDTEGVRAERAACLDIAIEVLREERAWSLTHAAVARIIAERIALRGGTDLLARIPGMMP